MEYSICCLPCMRYISASKCGTMRSNCGRTMHIRFSLFPVTHRLKRWGWIIFSLCSRFSSHQKFPFASLQTFSSLLNFTISSTVQRHTAIHTVWFSLKLFSAYFMSVIPKNFPHAFYTRSIAHILVSVGILAAISHKHLHNLEMFSTSRERGRETESDIERLSERISSLFWFGERA